MKYILSVMANDVCYTFYGPSVNGSLPPVKKKIRIAGGANLPSSKRGFGEMTTDHSGAPLWTPSGLVTPVKDEDLALLMEHHVFKQHLESNMVEIVGNDITHNHKAVAKIASHMGDDDFAPLNNSRINAQIKVTLGESEQDRRI
ncbi:hypothetical protein Gekk315_00035 [Aeromonas phage Gekk3-15]